MKKPIYVDETEIAKLGLTYGDAIAAIRSAFAMRAAGDVPVVAKIGLHPPDGSFFHAMPAVLGDLAVVKWVASGARSTKGNYINAHLIATDVQSGQALAILDFAGLTGMRTAAVSALAASFLSAPDSSVLGVLGCGVQARSHLGALSGIRPIKRVIAASRSPSSAAAFAAEAESMGFAAEVAEPGLDQLYEADILLTASAMDATPVLDGGRMKKGSLILAIELARSWAAKSLVENAVIGTDDIEHAKGLIASGFMSNDFGFEFDLASLVSGGTLAWSPDQVFAFVPPGMALADAAIAKLVIHRIIPSSTGGNV